MRDTNAVTEDLNYILDTAPGGRPEDVLHVLLGDVYAEVGNLQGARAEYEQVTGASAFAAEQVKLRLKEGKVSPEAIALVRMGTGTRCAMCHAPGTDN
jgi:predicted negative regulator of RcsB-dependent stress response